jgi:hypothetical protein
LTLSKRLYVLDFAGGGAVHLLGKNEYLYSFAIFNFVYGLSFQQLGSIQIESTLFLSKLSAGGMAGLMVCLFARFQEWWDKRDKRMPLVSKINHRAIWCT